MPSVKDLLKGYGPDFPKLEDLLGIEPDEAQLLMLEAPTPALSRYLKNVHFMNEVTSQKSIGRLRFNVIIGYLIALSDALTRYGGRLNDQKVVHNLTEDDKMQLRKCATTPADIVRAEAIEKFTEHDTAAATDYVKILIGTRMPHLEAMIEGVHFANTSEDVMGNVFGIVGNKLVYGYFMPALLDFCEKVMGYVEKYEEKVPLMLPGLTHQQAAEPTTLGKKFMTRLFAIDKLVDEHLRDKNGEFRPFSGKLGGALGNLTTHYAAYPDINWRAFSRNFVEGFGLGYDKMTDQCVTYTREAQLFTTIGNILTHVIQFTDNFVRMASCPGQLFVKRKKKGAKGSSIMPNKSNAWAMEGAIKMLTEAQENLFLYARELPRYTHEGDMGRSYMMRNMGTMFMPIFIGLNRIGSELQSYGPNPTKIDAFFSEYPGMAASVMQTVLKRMGIEGDAYRIIQDIAINPDGTYANGRQFRTGLEQKMEELQLPPEWRQELLFKLDPKNIIGPADAMAKEIAANIKEKMTIYRAKLEKYRAAA